MKSPTKPFKLHPFRGNMKTVEEIASALGLSKRAVYLRLQRGIPVDETMKRGPLPGSKTKSCAKQTNQKVKQDERRTICPVTRQLPRTFNRRTDLSALFSHG